MGDNGYLVKHSTKIYVAGQKKILYFENKHYTGSTKISKQFLDSFTWLKNGKSLNYFIREIEEIIINHKHMKRIE